MKQKVIPLLFYSMFYSLTFLFISCKNEVSFDHLEKIASKQFALENFTEQIHPNNIKIAIDISKSLQGFAKTGELNQLLRKTITSLGPYIKTQFYAFERDSYQIDDYLEFFKPNKFSGTEANFKKLFSIIEKDSNAVLIIITDLQFNNQKYYFDLVDLFQSEIANDKYIKLFNSKIYFDGLIFPQFINKNKFHYSGERPIYAICIASKKYASFIENLLKNIMPWENSLTLVTQHIGNWKIIRANKNTYIYGNRLLIDCSNDLRFRIKIISPSLLEWGEWSKDEIFVDTYYFEDTSFKKYNQDIIVDDVYTQKDTLYFSIYANKILAKSNLAWNISLIPKSLPSWIIEQTCKPADNQTDKTLMLQEFVQDIINPISKPFKLSTFNVLIKCK